MSVSAAEIFEKSIAIKQSLMEDEGFLSTLESLSRKAAQVISRGGKLLVCGNGGSASDSMHLVGEVVGRFQCERPGWACHCALRRPNYDDGHRERLHLR